MATVPERGRDDSHSAATVIPCDDNAPGVDKKPDVDVEKTILGDDIRTDGPLLIPQTPENGSLENGSLEDRSLEDGSLGDGNAINYKSMPWYRAGSLMVAETISLGILSLAHAVKTIGLIPGLVVIVFFGLMATYTGYVYGQFAIRYPKTKDVGEIAEVLFGRWVGTVLGFSAALVLLFIMAAHITSFAIGMNVLTQHGTCSITFMTVGALLSFICCLPRKLHDMAPMAVISFISIAAATIITMVGIAMDNEHAGQISLFKQASPVDTVIAILNVILAYAGHICYPGFVAELKKPEDFPKALAMMQSITISFYVVTAVVIYCFAGDYVKSPALNSATPLVMKIAWGIAMPSIVIAGVINGAVAIKKIYFLCWEDLLKKKAVTREKSFRAYASWCAINALLWFLAWLIAELIPSFHLLLAVVSALFMGFFSYGFSSLLWYHMNQGQLWSSNRQRLLTVINAVILTVGILICVVGLWATVSKLIDGGGGRVFACADSASEKIQVDG